MSKQEFLQRLRQALSGEVSGSVIEENLRYYEEYISQEAARGQSEQDVTASIGDPRLIAKTIIDAAENAQESTPKGSFYDSYQKESQTVYDENGKAERSFHTVDLSKWYWKVLGVAAVILFFVVISAVITGIFSLVIPLLGPVLMILFVVWLLRGMRK